MTYEAMDLRTTCGQSSQGLSPLTIYRACNTTSHAKAHATKARGRRDIGGVMMMPESLTTNTQPDLESLDN